MGAVGGDLAALLVAQQVERRRDVEGGLRQDGAQQQARLRQAEVPAGDGRQRGPGRRRVEADAPGRRRPGGRAGPPLSAPAAAGAGPGSGAPG